MSYHIYTTKGLILSHWPRGEADRVYDILTRNLGLVRASALGVRKESSKLRGSIEPYSFAKISLVRGKEYWRLTSAEFIQRVLPTETVSRPLVLMEKLIQGESSHSELFDMLEREILCPEQGEMFEERLVSRILFHLGYMKESDLFLAKKALVETINEGIRATSMV